MSVRARAYLMLVTVSVIWGIAGPVIKYTLVGFPPFLFLTYRFWLTSMVALPLLWVLKPRWPQTKQEWLGVGIFGLFNSTVNLGLLFLGFDRTTALDGTLISSTGPILVVIAGVLILKEKVTTREKVGLAIAFAGTVVTVIQPLWEGQTLALRNLEGNLLVLLANLTWVVAIVVSKVELKHKVSPFFLVTASFVLGFFTMAPIALMQSQFSVSKIAKVVFSSPLSSHLGVWYMAWISGLLAYTLYQKGQKAIEASEATLFGYLNPLFAAPLAVLWLGEKITLPFLVGAGVIAAGVVISEWKGGAFFNLGQNNLRT